MKDELIRLETAILAKEKGFGITINTAYDENGLLRECNPDFYLRGYHNKGVATLAPTQSLLQRWLREVHNIYVSSFHDLTPDGANIQYYTNWGTINDPSNKEKQYCPDGGYDKYSNWKTYEEALEQGLKNALKLVK